MGLVSVLVVRGLHWMSHQRGGALKDLTRREQTLTDGLVHLLLETAGEHLLTDQHSRGQLQLSQVWLEGQQSPMGVVSLQQA